MSDQNIAGFVTANNYREMMSKKMDLNLRPLTAEDVFNRTDFIAMEKTNCECHSYNGDIGSVPEVILDPRGYFPEITTKTVCVDACIAEEIEELWKHGFWTGGCCCGHNGYFGEDRPNVIIYEGYDAKAAKDLLGEIDPDRDWKVLQWKLTEVV